MPEQHSHIRITVENDGASTSSPTSAPTALPGDEQGMGGPFGMVASMLLLLVLLVLAKPVKIPAAAAPSRFRPYRSNRTNRAGGPQRRDGTFSFDDEDEPVETLAMRTARIDAALAVQRVVSVSRDVTTLGALTDAPVVVATAAHAAAPSTLRTHESGEYASLDESLVSQHRLHKIKSTPKDPNDYSMLSSDDASSTEEQSPVKRTSSMDEDGVNNPMTCCCICLESYQVGDVVAWSRSHSQPTDAVELVPPNSTCLHVFHKECIVQWLSTVTHDDCPSCRTVLLAPPMDVSVPTEGDESNHTSDTDMEQPDTEEGIELPESVQYQFEHATTGTSAPTESTTPTSPLAFVIVNGLIARVRRRQQRHRQMRPKPQKVPSCPNFP